MTFQARAAMMLMMAAAIVLTLSGCANKEKTARETFSKKQSCPLAQVTAKQRPDLSAHDLTFGASKGPPANIAHDPTRVAMWQKEQDDRRASWDASTTVFEVSGCNETQLYGCGIVSNGNSHSGQASCSSIK